MPGPWSHLTERLSRYSQWPRLSTRLALLLAVFVLILGTHGRFLWPTYHGLRLARDLVDARSAEQSLAEANTQMRQVRDYLQTPQGKELAARSQVMAVRPGERVVVLHEPPPEPRSAPVELAERFQAGLQRTGDALMAQVRRTGRALGTWVHPAETAPASPTPPSPSASAPAASK